MDKYLKANIIFSKFSRDYVGLKKDLPIRPSEMGVLNIITKNMERLTDQETKINFGFLTINFSIKKVSQTQNVKF